MIDGKLKRENIDDEEFDGLNNSNERLKRIIELKNKLLISSFLEIDFAINISDKKSRRFDLSEVIFKCIKVL